MHISTDTTIKNTSWLLIQHFFLLIGNAVFVIFVPRILGLTDYGRYTLITSIWSWFVIFGSLGFKPVITRFIPEWVYRKDTDSLSRFSDNAFSLFVFVGVVSCFGYLLITAVWLKDLSSLLFILLALAVMIRSISNFLFMMFLGLNRASRYGAGTLMRRWFSLFFIIMGFLIAGLKGVCAGILLSEAVLLVISLVWFSKSIRIPRLRFNLSWMKPYIRFGLIFYGGTLLIAAFWYSGESILKMMTDDYSQIAYFGLSRNIYLTFALTVSQVVIAFMPAMIHLRMEQKKGEMEKGLDLLMRSLMCIGFLITYGVLYLGNHLFGIILGNEYRILTVYYLPFTLTLLFFIPGHLGMLTAISHDRPDAHLKSGLIQLISFWMISPFLISRLGALGGSVGYLCAALCYTATMLALSSRFLRFPYRKWMILMFTGGILLIPALLKSGVLQDVLLFCISAAVFLLLMLVLRIIKISEIKKLYRILRKDSSVEPVLTFEDLAPVPR